MHYMQSKFNQWAFCGYYAKLFLKVFVKFFLAKYIQKWKHCLTNAYFVECALKCVWNILSVMIWDMKLWFHLNIQNWCVNWDGSSKVYQTLPIIQLCYMNLYFTFENKVALEKKMENIWFIFLHFQVPQRKLGKELEKGSSGKNNQGRQCFFHSNNFDETATKWKKTSFCQ